LPLDARDLLVIREKLHGSGFPAQDFIRNGPRIAKPSVSKAFLWRYMRRRRSNMSDFEQLGRIVEELISVMQLQAKELEKLVEHVQQVAGHIGYRHQLSAIASELSELHYRIKKLTADPAKD
jgi:hypothetical protein